MADLKDLFPNRVTETVQQPPSGVNVTEVNDKSVGSNIIGQAESQEQAKVAGEAEEVLKEMDQTAPDYIFTIEQGRHKITITPDNGVYNFHALCSCAWEGRFMTSDQAEAFAKKHLTPRRG